MIKRPGTRKLLKYVADILFIGALLLLLFSPDAKAWLIRQFLSFGFFKAEIKKNVGNKNRVSPVNFSYQDDKGNAASVSDLKGKVVLINFWAT